MNSTKTLDGRTFARMLAGGADNIRANEEYINDLNVFPVPDGDTGSNMCCTMDKGLADIGGLEPATPLGRVASAFASGTVLGARGNSGVILSQFFRGFANALSGLETAGVAELAGAFESGVKQAYAAVVNPTEGTILTVFREASEAVSKQIESIETIEQLLEIHVLQADDTLKRTTEMLPILAKAGVIDSGGAGYCYIARGMKQALENPAFKPSQHQQNAGKPSGADINLDAFTRDSELQFGYCTELLLRLQSAKVDVERFDPQVILDYLQSIGGDSIVCFKDGDVIKIHVHTPDPGLVLQQCRKYGEFLTVKIENMALQHQEVLMKKALKKNIAVIAVAPGEGIAEVFRGQGADITLGDNPSTGDFVNAISSIDAENYLILPDDANVMMAARQASEMVKGANVFVVPTKTVQEGFSALSIYTPDVPSTEGLVADMTDAASNVTSAQIACATRDAVLDGLQVKKGDFIAMYRKDHIVSARKSMFEALSDLLDDIDGIEDMEILTLFWGNGVTQADSQKAFEIIKRRFPDLQVDTYCGGQEVYCFYLGFE